MGDTHCESTAIGASEFLKKTLEFLWTGNNRPYNAYVLHKLGKVPQ